MAKMVVVLLEGIVQGSLSIEVECVARRIYRIVRESPEGFLSSHARIQGFSAAWV
jgi:hypothetical protein